MTKFQIRTVNYLIGSESVKTMEWRITNCTDLTGSDYKPSIIYVYQESSYSRDYIKKNKMT
jgi:hypothetical protein